ncbi:MAG TPA: peptidylprolyl isomerase [Ktedonobacterales bacterium]
MPKTAADKRAEARRLARVHSAHQAAAPQPATSRRVPQGRSARGSARRQRSFVERYPYATGIIVLAVIGLLVLIAHQARLGPWAPPSPPAAAHCDRTTHVCSKAPQQTIKTADAYTATIHTAKGNIVIQLEPGSAPKNVNNFVFLAQQHFYDGLPVSRVERVGQISPVTKHPSNLALVQTGVGGKDGGPGFAMPNEAPAGAYAEGTVAMANGSQFFICTGDNSTAISGTSFPIIGKVVSGLSVAQALNQGDRIESISIAVSTPTPTPAATASPAATGSPTATPTASQ